MTAAAKSRRLAAQLPRLISGPTSVAPRSSPVAPEGGGSCPACAGRGEDGTPDHVECERCDGTGRAGVR